MLRRWYDIERDLALADEMRRRMGRLFGELEAGTPVSTGNWPAANLYDAGEEIVAVLELPGVSEDDLNVEAHHEALTVAGTRRVELPEKVTVHRHERMPGQFSRSFGLPSPIQVEKTSASLRNGVLTVRMPKHPESQPKKISVSAE